MADRDDQSWIVLLLGLLVLGSLWLSCRCRGGAESAAPAEEAALTKRRWWIVMRDQLAGGPAPVPPGTFTEGPQLGQTGGAIGTAPAPAPAYIAPGTVGSTF